MKGQNFNLIRQKNLRTILMCFSLCERTVTLTHIKVRFQQFLSDSYRLQLACVMGDSRLHGSILSLRYRRCEDSHLLSLSMWVSIGSTGFLPILKTC